MIRIGERITISEFERDASAFIEATLERLTEEALPDSWLRRRWDSIYESQENPEELAFCEAAGALGVDPYTCTDQVAEWSNCLRDSWRMMRCRSFLPGVNATQFGMRSFGWMSQKLHWATGPCFRNWQVLGRVCANT